MSLVKMSYLLNKAQEGGYAVPAFNIYNIEFIRASIEAAEEMNSPLILQMYSNMLDGNDYKYLGIAAVELARRADVPIAVHLDHGKNANQIMRAISIGFSSVMFDGSLYDFETNIKKTKEMNELAKLADISFEGELGHVCNAKDLGIDKNDSCFTDPDEAAHFVEMAGVDCLAVAIGNAHGLYKATPKIDFSRLKSIQKKVTVPLVLHGGTGIPDEMIKKSIKLGICKINIATELSCIFYNAVKEQLEKDFMPIDLFMSHPIKELKKCMLNKISVCDSAGKAIKY